MSMVTNVSGVSFQPWSSVLAPGEVPVQQEVSRTEHVVTRLFCYQNALVSGLLQTRPYARAVMVEVHSFHGLPIDEVEEATEARIARQSILSEPGRMFRMLLTEAALWTRFGNTEVMAGQLTHLAEVARNGIGDADLRLGIVPRGVPLRHAKHGFNIYEGDEIAEAAEETIAGDLTITDANLVTDYRRVFDAVTELAVYGDDAARIIDAARVSMTSPGAKEI